MFRIALKPTGDMHIENLRLALLNFLVSKQDAQDLIVRIEDIDSKLDKGDDKKILELLNLFSIDYKQVIKESDFFKYHQQIAMQLLVDKKAFNCFCSNETLSNDMEKLKSENKPYEYSGFCQNLHDETILNVNAPFRVRIKKPDSNVSSLPSQIDSFEILKQDKSPTYNFACGVNDMLNDISCVIESDDTLLDTTKQIYVRNQIGYDKNITYIHIPKIDISNKAPYASIQWLIDEGFLPVAIANYLLSLGYDTPKEIFTIEEAISWFNVSKISQSSIKFDLEKLKYINKEHIKTFDNMRLSKILGYADEDMGKLAKVYLEEVDTIKAIKEKINQIFNTHQSLEGYQDELNAIKNSLDTAPFIDNFSDFKKYILNNTTLTEESLQLPLRFILTGTTKGPNLSEIYPLIKNYLGEII